jgi:hypothetical protein
LGKPVDIQLDVKNVDAVLNKFDRIIARAQYLNQTLNSGPTGAPGGGGGPGQRSPGRPKAPPVQDINKRIMNALMTSRVNFSKNGISLSPLLGQMSRVFGPVIASAVGVAVAGIKMLGDAAAQSSKDITNISEAGYRTGGKLSPGTHNIGFGVGGDSGTGADIATRIADAIASNPYVGGVAGTHGIRNIPGPYGNLDTGKMLEDFVKMLRELDPDTQKRVIRSAGVPELQRFMPENMSQASFDAMFPKRNKITDAVERMNTNMENERRALDANKARHQGIPLTPWDNMKNQWNTAEWLINKAQNALYNGLDRLVGGIAGSDKKEKAVKENTDAIKQNTASRNGVAGGGVHAAGAVPSEWKYRQMERALESQQIQLGGLTL